VKNVLGSNQSVEERYYNGEISREAFNIYSIISQEEGIDTRVMRGKANLRLSISVKWSNNERMVKMTLFTGVHQINFRVKDINRSYKWYQEILGLAILRDYGKTIVLGFSEKPSTNETTICLIELSEGESLIATEYGTHPVIEISPEQAENCKNTLTDKGVTILEGGGAAHFKFLDPDDNLLEAFLPNLYEDERFRHLI
jgi:catechol 2,3-dioxygenase-like lactoylglutathione lyase family enzyme